jgi:nucleoside-diphosphate kinase
LQAQARFIREVKFTAQKEAQSLSSTRGDFLLERTLAIIKPDAVERRLSGEILRQIEANKFAVRGLKMLHLTRGQAERFYEVHKTRAFFNSLCQYMSSGPVIVAVLEGERAIERWRELMGATDPAKAAAGTLRQQFGTNIEQNVVHGSDGPETAVREIEFFFSRLELTE